MPRAALALILEHARERCMGALPAPSGGRFLDRGSHQGIAEPDSSVLDVDQPRLDGGGNSSVDPLPAEHARRGLDYFIEPASFVGGSYEKQHPDVIG
ncbi:MAG: hypothetical protein JW895_02170 [Thermoleophilaceae bacterium]|nr:hypothetical protein [Thermoleophilaceae bacterium]